MTTAPPGLARRDLTRPQQGRMVAGVSVGLADAFGLDPNAVRGAFVVLGIAGGLGVVLYGVAWALMPEAPERRVRTADADVVSTVALGAVVLGTLLALRSIGLWPGDVFVWPVAAAMVGLALLAMRGGAPDDAAERPPWPWLARLPPDAAGAVAVLVGTRRGALARMVAGIACVAAGVGALILTVDSWRALRGALVAAVAVLGGIALVVGPTLSRLAHALVTERRERIRSQERAEVAAHLHDSVLQTLALVQRRAGDPREVVRLARLQERELRAWLLGTEPAGASEHPSLGRAVEAIAADVETERGVPVEVVRVRDCPADGMEPLLLAAREAIVNAAQHAGAVPVAVYLEVEPGQATIWVRDRGRGFDPGAVPDDRGGIRNSIVGRMQRAGGGAAVQSAAGEGTEVELTLPRPRGEPPA